MSNTTYRFGILGCGMIANIHADAISKMENAKLVGVCDNSPSAAERFAAQHGTRAYESYEEMLADPSVDVVCICTPSGFHAQNAMDALKHGKHVALEKPMALTSESAQALVEASKASKRLLTVISQLRFSEDIRRVKRLIEEDAFGKLSLCHLSMKYYRTPEYYSSCPWKGTLAFDGGGALMNQGIHGIDLMLYMMGSVKSVQGHVKTISHRIEAEDTAVALLEFENGALGTLEGSTCAYPGFERRIAIHGDRGYALIKENKIEALMCNGQAVDVEDADKALGSFNTSSNPAGMSSDAHRKQLENLISAIEGKESVFVDAMEGYRAVCLIEKIYQASAKAQES